MDKRRVEGGEEREETTTTTSVEENVILLERETLTLQTVTSLYGKRGRSLHNKLGPFKCGFYSVCASFSSAQHCLLFYTHHH